MQTQQAYNSVVRYVCIYTYQECSRQTETRTYTYVYIVIYTHMHMCNGCSCRVCTHMNVLMQDRLVQHVNEHTVEGLFSIVSSHGSGILCVCVLGPGTHVLHNKSAL